MTSENEETQNDTKINSEEDLKGEFDYLDLSIDLRKRHDLRKKMTPEMKEERRRKLQISKIKEYKNNPTKKIQNLERKIEVLKDEINGENDFDHLDLSIDLRLRPDLRKKMTPEMKAERKRKQQNIVSKKNYHLTSSKIKKQNREKYGKTKITNQELRDKIKVLETELEQYKKKDV